jgi:hypothetical protein
MLFECTKRQKCPFGLKDCCFCCKNTDCEERCETICDDVKNYSTRVHVPIEKLGNLEVSDEELLREYVSIVRHFNQGHVKHYKQELREEILRRMEIVKDGE